MKKFAGRIWYEFDLAGGVVRCHSVCIFDFLPVPLQPVTEQARHHFLVNIVPILLPPGADIHFVTIRRLRRVRARRTV